MGARRQAQGLEDGFKALADEIDKVGGSLEGGYNKVTEELTETVDDVGNALMPIADAVQNPDKPVEVLTEVVKSVLPPPAAVTKPVKAILDRRRRSRNVVDIAL